MTTIAFSFGAVPSGATLALPGPAVPGMAQPIAFEMIFMAQTVEASATPPVAELPTLATPTSAMPATPAPTPDVSAALELRPTPTSSPLTEVLSPRQTDGAEVLAHAARPEASSVRALSSASLPARDFRVATSGSKKVGASPCTPDLSNEDRPAEAAQLEPSSMTLALPVMIPVIMEPPQASDESRSTSVTIATAPPLAPSRDDDTVRVEGDLPTSSEPTPFAPVVSGVLRGIALFSVPVSGPAATSGPDIAVVRHLDLARGDAWLDDLARDIAGAAVRGGQLKFALAPETLGRLDVEVRHGDAGVSIHMAARSEIARDILSSAQPRLVDEIRAQGVRVTGAEIAADMSGSTGDGAGNAPRQPQRPVIEARDALHPPERPVARTSTATARYA